MGKSNSQSAGANRPNTKRKILAQTGPAKKVKSSQSLASSATTDQGLLMPKSIQSIPYQSPKSTPEEGVEVTREKALVLETNPKVSTIAAATISAKEGGESDKESSAVNNDDDDLNNCSPLRPTTKPGLSATEGLDQLLKATETVPT